MRISTDTSESLVAALPDRGAARHGILAMPAGSEIPKIIHQTYYSRDLPAELQANVDTLKAENPGWEHRFYDDDDIAAFITGSYGPHILAYFERINPVYSAAKIDLFRYLLMYKVGGVYLDIKSTFTRSIDSVLQPGDQYLLSGWSNRPGEEHAGFGLAKDLDMIDGGEFQQWHIIAAPGHPFLKAVIESVLTNIDTYAPWKHGTGADGVFRVTGPIAYTLAIHPLLALHPHRAARTDAEFGLLYSVLDNSKAHKPLFKSHYKEQTEAVVTLHGLAKFAGDLYIFAKKIKKQIAG